MSEHHESARRGGIGCFTVLTIVFVTLKLCHVIDWSWWWVVLPTIASVGLWMLGAVIIVLAYVLGPVIDEWAERRRWRRR